MPERTFVNQSQPQTLVVATFLLYVNAAFGLLQALGGLSIVAIALVAAAAAGGYGVANERRWGYVLGIVAATIPFLFRFLAFGNPIAGDVIGLIFDVALLVALLHPMSREYQRIWFK